MLLVYLSTLPNSKQTKKITDEGLVKLISTPMDKASQKIEKKQKADVEADAKPKEETKQ